MTGHEPVAQVMSPHGGQLNLQSPKLGYKKIKQILNMYCEASSSRYRTGYESSFARSFDHKHELMLQP